jgi:hypothetical protein
VKVFSESLVQLQHSFVPKKKDPTRNSSAIEASLRARFRALRADFNRRPHCVRPELERRREVNVTQAITSDDTSRNGLLAVAAGGVLTGVLTPLLPYLIDKIVGTPGDFRIALVAIPFAILVLMLVRQFSSNPWWAALTAAVVTMIAFVCAVNAAIWIDGQVGDVAKAIRNIFAGLAGGLTGAAIMALGICLLPSGPRDLVAWVPMLVVGTLAGALLALDSALDLDLTSILYPVWQAGVGVGLAMALRSSVTAPRSP